MKVGERECAHSGRRAKEEEKERARRACRARRRCCGRGRARAGARARATSTLGGALRSPAKRGEQETTHLGRELTDGLLLAPLDGLAVHGVAAAGRRRVVIVIVQRLAGDGRSASGLIDEQRHEGLGLGESVNALRQLGDAEPGVSGGAVLLDDVQRLENVDDVVDAPPPHPQGRGDRLQLDRGGGARSKELEKVVAEQAERLVLAGYTLGAGGDLLLLFVLVVVRAGQRIIRGIWHGSKACEKCGGALTAEAEARGRLGLGEAGRGYGVGGFEQRREHDRDGEWAFARRPENNQERALVRLV